MKIALVALPAADDPHVAPPLPLGYLAALLEQQRHLVRICDLALPAHDAASEPLAQLRTFRPHLTVVVGDDPYETTSIAGELPPDAAVLTLTAALRDMLPAHVAAHALRPIHGQGCLDEQNVIRTALAALEDDLDQLPFPARHLLALERYPLGGASSALCTTLLVGRAAADGRFALRQVALLAAELRSLAHEHGIVHALLCGPPLTDDMDWLAALLATLRSARPGVAWEAPVDAGRLTPELLDELQGAGCEGLHVEFDAMAVLEAQEMRRDLVRVIREGQARGLRMVGRIQLDPHDAAVLDLVDVTGTFGLDDVRFLMRQHALAAPGDGQPEVTLLAEQARDRYQASRGRQRFVDRFGAHLGPMIWRAGRAGLLGPAWQRQAGGDQPGLLAEGRTG